MDLFYTYTDNFSGKNEKEKQHNAGRYIIEYAANHIYKIENPEIEIKNKKPGFKYSDINFSISHSNNIAAVCFDKYPLGLDIEFIKKRNYMAIVKRMKFKMQENTINEFYKNWTLYEAGIKLQNKVQSIKTQIFLDNYMLCLVSGKKDPIELNINCLFF